tara:strand:- start:1981 stop:2409 length:429 start_codon:yes stop_codon:yes gene_type:complete
MNSIHDCKKSLISLLRYIIPEKVRARARPSIHRIRKEPSKTIEGCLADIRNSENSLSSVAKEFEQNFMDVLQTLETLEGVSSDLTQESDILLEQCKSSDNPIITTNELLEPLLDFIGDSGNSIKSSIKELSKDQKKIDQTLS